MFDYFRNCSSNAHHVCCEDSLTEDIYIYTLFSVRWPCSSLKVTAVSQNWQMFNLYYTNHICDTRFQTWHRGRHICILCSCSFRWPWPWCKVTVDRQRQKYQRWFILTTKANNKHSSCCNGRQFFTWPWLCKRLYGLASLIFIADAVTHQSA